MPAWLSRSLLTVNDRPALLLMFTSLAWAGNAIAGQLAVGEIAPFQLVLARWVLVSAAMWSLYGAEVRAHWSLIRPRLGWIAATAALGFTGFNGLFYLASQRTTGVNIGILQGAIPVIVLVMAFFAYGPRVGPIQILGVCITLLGVILVATGGAPLSVFDLGLNPGDSLMLLACCLYALYATALQKRPQMPGRAFFALLSVVAVITAVPPALIEAVLVAPPAPTATGWWITLYVAVFPSCLAQLAFLRGVDLIGPGRAGVYVNLVPVFAAVLAIALLGQAFAPYHAAALVMVLGGIWLAQRRI
jgi:drug/metabolite transporter (DMT)-like permease